MSASGGIVLQNSFWTTEDKFSGLWAQRSNNRAGNHSNDELTGNFGSALEDTSIGNYRLVALFAESHFWMSKMAPPMVYGSETYLADRRRDPTPINSRRPPLAQNAVCSKNFGRF
jgi:hypothetical protein